MSYDNAAYTDYCDVERPVTGTYRKENFDQQVYFTPGSAASAASPSSAEAVRRAAAGLGHFREHQRQQEQARERLNNQGDRVRAGTGGGGGGGGGIGRGLVAYPGELELNQIGKYPSTPETATAPRHRRKMKYAPLLVRQFLAEFLGTFILVLFGDGSIAQYILLEPEQKNFLSVAFGYGFALMLGILVSGGVSGGHLNPAVTLAMACVRKCSWLCIPVYWAAQYLGALLGAAVLYGTYNDAIVEHLGTNMSSAGIFSSFPKPEVSVVTLIFDQALGTALLLIIILAVTDKKNMDVASGLIAPLIGLGLTAIHISLAYNAGCAINPARDFSPRLLTLIAGFGSEVFTTADHFFWIPWVIPHVGGVLGALVYHFCVELHHPDVDIM